MAKRKRDDGAARWTYELEEKFVELWQQYGCLYDVTARDYHDRLKKEKCWRTIAEALKQPVGEVQTKAASLRTQYGKVLRPKPSGSGDKELTTRQKWILNNLQFLQPFVVHRVSQSTLNLDDLEQSITDEGGEDQETEEDVCESSTSTSHHTSTSSTPQTPLETSSSHHHHKVTINPERANYKAKQKSRDKSSDELEIEKVNILKNMSESLVDASKDVDQTFGKQVVTEMKLIKDPLTKMRLRRNILMMLYDAHENEARLALDPPRALRPQTTWQGHTNFNQPYQNTSNHVPSATPPVSYLRAVEEAYDQERDRM
ncbi:uncharacterized protein LOC125273144 [Megalobrama amblycephala]|uniref:uncharacterized protein LOC125273144 n=1 Tax=Megalobrama amblycephala TaxID=75352 RepID=UPI0020141D46|nr:uncharacterized protein LOC125273144 [Megalobrama amblycephala]